jgi:putative transposase
MNLTPWRFFLVAIAGWMNRQQQEAIAYAESFVRTIKRECLTKMVLFGERHVRYVIDQYVEHYDLERPHKGLDYRPPVESNGPSDCRDGPVLCQERPGGLLKSYCRRAA